MAQGKKNVREPLKDISVDQSRAETGEGSSPEDTAIDRIAGKNECGDASLDTDESNLAEALARAREEACENHDKLLRLAAEFENYKKRIAREHEGVLKYAEEKILKETLPLIDNLERAIEQSRHTDDVAVFMEGVELAYRDFLKSLAKFGLKAVESKGKTFDPNFHEAIAVEESVDIPAQEIINEYQKGYLYKDRLIRAAKVVVSKGAKTEG